MQYVFARGFAALPSASMLLSLRPMSGEIEAIGDAISGSLISRTIEPAHGEGGETHGEHSHGGRCLNCGNFLNGPFCNGCGQARHTHRSIMAFIHDLMHGVLHFEGKLWRTLPLLFWQPGELTRRYINGERARFFSPLALFLFAVFLTFAVFSTMGSGTDSGDGFDALDAAHRQSAINGAADAMAQDIRETEARLTQARTDHKPAADISAIEQELQSKRTVAARTRSVFGFGVGADGEPQREKNFSISDIKTGVPFVDQMIAKANDDPALMLYKLQSNAYKYAWALIPLSAPFLWLLYPFSRRFGLYDHLVFVTFSISFMLLLLMLSRLATAFFEWIDSGVGGAILLFVMLLYPPFHIARQVRGTYRSSRFGAVVRAAILFIIAAINLMVFMAGLLALGALG